jgi:histidyl-tRNA synthetase
MASLSMANEKPIGLARGTEDWFPEQFARLCRLEETLLGSIESAGYARMRSPILEFSALHERKSGAGIVSKLIELRDEREGALCLRPELTASIVRAYATAAECPSLPWRVCMSGQVFRAEDDRPGYDREFTQVGVERIGDGGAEADAEIIWLADHALARAGVADAALRIGHVGVILEMLERSGLPPSIGTALVEVISESAAEGRDVRAVEAAVERLAGWLLHEEATEGSEPATSAADAETARLFRELVPEVTGRRSAAEIITRVRRKWELGRSLRGVLARLREQVHALAALRGPAVTVADRLRAEFQELAPHSVAELLELVARLDDRGISPHRLELDMGFGRGLGFYTQMIFELIVAGPNGPIEVCGGGRYDGLARALGSDRDDRGAGFAIGLERLASLQPARSHAPIQERAARS